MRAAAWAPVRVLKELVVRTAEADHAGHVYPDVGAWGECGRAAGRAWAAASILQVPFLPLLPPQPHTWRPPVAHTPQASRLL